MDVSGNAPPHRYSPEPFQQLLKLLVQVALATVTAFSIQSADARTRARPPQDRLALGVVVGLAAQVRNDPAGR
ncbi:hypothetical protein [Streptomyces sp. NPDC048710]|uniref:hypothetical protein n=1 Tax=Streptomyces sp. NPDC048710 TaxID=3365586 RepID=UPI00371A8FA9